MFNVIFYEDFETTTASDGRTITTRVPSRYVCTTMTSANSFFKESTLQKFVGSFPALSSATNMFEFSKIQYVNDVIQVKDESGEGYRDDIVPADFSSVIDGSFMFSDCANLTNINIDLRSLIYADDIFAGCTELTSISGNMDSLLNGDGLFSDCNKLETFEVSMKNLESANSMFANTKINSIPSFNSLESAHSMYKSCSMLGAIEVTFPSLIDGDMMFAYSSVNSIKITAPKLFSAEQMFYICPNLTSVNASFESLSDGYQMFYNCDKLDNVKMYVPSMLSAVGMFNGSSLFRSFNGDLRNLKDGTEMFKSTSISEFSPTSLDNLETGNSMFYGNNFRNWKIDMPKLASGVAMFAGSTIPAIGTGLTNFTADLSSLKNGYQMFLSSSYLTEFNCVLPSLTDGTEMFKGCKLNAQSIMYIVESLPTATNNPIIDLGINSAANNVDEFAKSTGLYSSFNEIKDILANKGWNGRWWDSSGNSIS